MKEQKDHELFRLEGSPGFVISKASKTITNRLHQNFKIECPGVTVEQWILLDELYRKDGSSQLEIATATYRDQPCTSRIIDTMVKREMVYRSQDLSDKRTNLIFITEQGKIIRDKLIGIVQDTINTCIAGIDPGDLSTCMKVLFKITDNATRRVDCLEKE